MDDLYKFPPEITYEDEHDHAPRVVAAAFFMLAGITEGLIIGWWIWG